MTPHSSDVPTDETIPSPSPASLPSLDSPGEAKPVTVTEEGPSTQVKKGRGRPKVDGTPGKLDREIPIQTPSPEYKKYWTNATNRNQYPSQLIRWYRDLPQWAKDRMIVYVERDWPVLIKITAADKQRNKALGLPVEYNYIDKMDSLPEDMATLRDKYGAGDYHLSLNDQQAGVTLAQCWVKENWRDIQQFPPVDQRIQKVENVDLNDPANRSYVEYLRGRGKLPEQNSKQGEASMAEATAVSQMTGMMGKVLDKVLDSKDRDKGNNDTTATVVREVMGVMGDVNKKAAEVMQNAYQQTEANRTPAMSLKDMVEVVKELKGEEKGSDTMMMVKMMEMMQANSAATMSMIVENLKGRVESSEKLVEKLLERQTTQTTAGTGEAAGGSGQVSGLVSGVDQIVQVVEKLGFRKNGVGSTEGGVSSGGGGWKDVIPDILSSVQGLVQTGVQAYVAKVQSDQRDKDRAMMAAGFQVTPQTVHAPPPNMAPMHTPSPAEIANRHPESGPLQGNPAMTPEEQAQADDERAYVQFMGEITRPLMNHINRELGGDAFGQWMIDSYDPDTYEQIRAQGKDMFVQGVMGYAPLEEQLRGRVTVLEKFADEFVRMEEIQAEDALADEGEEENEEVTV